MHSISDSALPDGVVSAEQTFPVPLICSKNRISATAASFTNQRGITHRFDTAPRFDGKSSVEELHSPKYREMQCEREMKRLQSQLNETEDQLVRVEFELSETKKKMESLVEEVAIKKTRIRDLEREEKLYLRTQEEMEAKLTMMVKQVEQMQRHHEIQKERLVVYKENEEKWELEKTDLEEALQNKYSTIALLERKLRDINDELLNSSNLLKSTENECTRLQREAEELKRNNELQREEYQASITDWRNRLEKTVAEHLASAAADMERNANVAQEMRAKTEEVEKLQELLEIEKKQVQSVLDEWTSNFREQSMAVTSKLASLEAELARRDELQSRTCDRCENLEKMAKAEKDERDARINSAQALVEELQKELSESQKIVCKGREELEFVLSEKDKINNERMEVVNELERKKEGLKEAMLIVDGLREEIAKYLAETGYKTSMKIGEDWKCGDLYRQLSRVTMVVEAYGRQFEQLEMRLAVDDKRQRQCIQDVDMTETISDLRYRLFAADQKLVIYEKERTEWKTIIQRLEDREEEAKQKNSEMSSEMNHWLCELSELREGKKNMEKTISDYRAELESKATQLERTIKSLRDSQQDNTLHLRLITSLKEEYEHERNASKQNEKRLINECEELRTQNSRKDEQIKVLAEKVSGLELVNVDLRLEVNSLKKENENYRVTLDKSHFGEVEGATKSPNCSERKSLLQKSRERGQSTSASFSTTKEYLHHASHDPSAILVSRRSVKGEHNLRIGVAHEKSKSAHRFLKRTSFYQMTRTLSEFKPN